jgi:hypothetical protein
VRNTERLTRFDAIIFGPKFDLGKDDRLVDGNPGKFPLTNVKTVFAVEEAFVIVAEREDLNRLG